MSVSRLKPSEEGSTALHTEWLEQRRHGTTAGPACVKVRRQQRGHDTEEQRHEKRSEEGGGEEEERATVKNDIRRHSISYSV